MGFDWENVLATSGAGLDGAHDAAVSAVMYPESPESEPARPFPVGSEHDDADGLTV
ncbi:hypothetical protein [Amycolatopsis coloradensis]|uniref:hypothetical protein n=1 Tax=Amycolatopsis coloradensis TaxID=76021 RepID=UPI00142D7424|nr:hypothetical protein [Amycolatopsis coloradensis]